MRCIAILGAALALSGCATEPMTDEQRQFAMQYLMNRPQPQPYVQPMPAPIQQNSPRNCISSVAGQTIYTNCN